MRDGPDVDFREPHGTTADGFSTAPPECGFAFGKPEDVAYRKAKLFPGEGGPAIIEFELPADLADRIVSQPGMLEEGKAIHVVDEIRFERGYGIEGLKNSWASLNKSVTFLQAES